MARLRHIADLVARMLRLMVGIPDYQTYVDHCRVHHPERPVMDYKTFFRDRQAARYDTGSGRFRGCC